MRRYFRPLLITAATFGAIVVMLAAAVLLVEIQIPLDNYRDRLADAAARALKAEVRIGGSLTFFTGCARRHPGGGTADCGGSTGRPLVDRGEPRAPARASPGPLQQGNPHRGGPPSSRRLYAQPVVRNRRRVPGRRFAESAWRIAAVERVTIRARVHLDRRAPAPLTTKSRKSQCWKQVPLPAIRCARFHGARFKKQPWHIELQGPLLALLVDGAQPVPFEIKGEFAGARLRAGGTASLKPLLADADLTFKSEQLAATALALTAAPLKDFGPLSVRAHVRAGRHPPDSAHRRSETRPRDRKPVNWCSTAPGPGRA